MMPEDDEQIKKDLLPFHQKINEVVEECRIFGGGPVFDARVSGTDGIYRNEVLAFGQVMKIDKDGLITIRTYGE